MTADQLHLNLDAAEAEAEAQPGLWVPGLPISKGSGNWWARGWIDETTGKVMARAFPAKDETAKREQAWEETVRTGARDWWGPQIPLEGRVGLTLAFYFHRPLSHYRTKNRKPCDVIKPQFMNLDYVKTPDADKLARCVMDALAGEKKTPKRPANPLIYKNDCQVGPLHVTRKYCCRFTAEEGVRIYIEGQA